MSVSKRLITLRQTITQSAFLEPASLTPVSLYPDRSSTDIRITVMPQRRTWQEEKLQRIENDGTTTMQSGAIQTDVTESRTHWAYAKHT